MLADAPVPDGRTVLTAPDATSDPDGLWDTAASSAFHTVTNTIDALNRQIRKIIKTRGHFPTEDATRKLIYLAIDRAERNWRRAYN